MPSFGQPFERLINIGQLAARQIKFEPAMKMEVMPQFENLIAIRPKALANFSPGFELARTLGSLHLRHSNPERVRQPPNPFRV